MVVDDWKAMRSSMSERIMLEFENSIDTLRNLLYLLLTVGLVVKV